MLFQTLSSKERIIKAKLDLNIQSPFFAYILMHMNIEKTKSTDAEHIPTMAVDKFGRLYWNEDFVAKLSNEQLKGVLAHEALHIATLTFPRKGKRDMLIWNIATDLVNNYTLVLEGFSLPKDITDLVPNHDGKVVIDKGNLKLNVKNKTAEQVYDELIDYIDDLKDQYENSEDKEGIGTLDKHLETEDEDGKSNSEDGKANEKYWKKKMAEGAAVAKGRGKFSSHLGRSLGVILESKVDWRKLLYNFITKEIPYDYTMARPGRRFYSSNIYFPSVLKENLEIIVGVDVSGSISDEEYNNFMSEIFGIFEAFYQIKARVIFWAADVHEADDIEVSSSTKDAIFNHRVRGGGGTTLSCFTEYIEQNNYKSKVYIILTDGYIEPNPILPTGNILYVLTHGGTDNYIKDTGIVCKLSDIDC